MTSKEYKNIVLWLLMVVAYYGVLFLIWLFINYMYDHSTSNPDSPNYYKNQVNVVVDQGQTSSV